MPTIDQRPLAELATRIFIAAGASPENAEGVVSSLISANLAGHDSHGVLRIPAYVNDVKKGRLDPKGQPTIVRETTTTAVVDGAATFGQVGARYATTVALDKARDGGLAIVGANRCHHTGRIGEWVEQIAAAGMIGMATTSGPNGPYSVAPFGGAKGSLGTNPMAWAVPRASGHPPILMDYATSAVAQGKLQLARAKGDAVPAGSIINARGEPTTNVEDFFVGGLLLPFAGHKGYSLGVMVELLAVGLSAGDRVPDTAATSCLQVLAINPAALRPEGEFIEYVETVAARLKAVPAAPGFNAVLLPGEPEAQTRAARARDGIPLPDRTWEALQATASELGVAVPAAA
jgi:hydroxycarboxylate dehydrogenase B